MKLHICTEIYLQYRGSEDFKNIFKPEKGLLWYLNGWVGCRGVSGGTVSVYSSYRLTLHLHSPTLSPSTTTIVYTSLIFTNTMVYFLYSIFNQTLSSTSTIIVYTPFTIINTLTHLALNPHPKSCTKFEASEFEIEFMPGATISTRKDWELKAS